MKCDNLQRYSVDIDYVPNDDGAYMDADEVNEAIAELKHKLDKAIAERDGNQECIDALKRYITRLKEEKDKLKEKLNQEQLWRSYWNEDDYAMVNELERLFNENEKLKEKLEDAKATASAESVDAGMRERRLRRALWLARAERAKDRQQLFHFSLNFPKLCIDGFYDSQGVRKELSPKQWIKVFNKVEIKCFDKAEEYK